MSINKIMLVCFSFIGAFAVLTFTFVFKLNALTEDTERLAKVRYHSYLAADELRQSSDDLTRLGRTYAVSGEAKYEKMYMDILDIRNGKKPRPDNYHRIYWDLVLNYGDKPKADTETIELSKIMKDLGFTEQEFSKLKQAQKNSDKLVAMEVKAMNAVKGKFQDAQGEYTNIGIPDLELARNLLHSNEYHQEKAKIMAPLDEFLHLLEERTQIQFINTAESTKSLVLVSTGLMLLIIVTAVVGYIILTRFVTKPINEMSMTLSYIGKNQDLRPRLDMKGGSEIIQISENINYLIDNYSLTVEQVNNINDEVSGIVKSITALGHENLKLSSQQKNEVEMVATAMEQMTNSLSTVTENTSRAEEHAANANKGASSGKTTFEVASSAFSSLETEFDGTRQIIDQLASESSHVGNVLDVIKSIAEQTNLLALNAAIEAARAGEQGRGFAVVADEVRSLAERTQASTSEIEEMISNLQHKAEKATSSIKESADKIKSASERAETASNVLVDIQTSATDIHALNTVIASATEEQLGVSTEIARNLVNIHDLSIELDSKVQDFNPLILDIHNRTMALHNHVAQFKIK